MIGAAHGIDAFTASPDALVRVDFDEQARAAANEAAFNVRDPQCRRSRADTASSMHWDGRDERGQVSRAGVYFLWIDSPEHRQTRKIVYLGP
jgi:hypothetical protein